MPCLRLDQLRFVQHPLTRSLWHWLYPIQCVLGVLGNGLILWVLASDDVHNVASDLLAAVSFCDMAFLLVMFFPYLSSYDALSFHYKFRYFYLTWKQHIIAVANWMSAAAIWLILAVSIERFLVVRSPLRSKMYWQRGKMVLVLSSIFFATGILTVYHHFEYDCEIVEFCNGTQLYDFCYYAGQQHFRTHMKKEHILPSEAKMVYMRASTIVNAALVVFVPIVFVIVLNMLMLRALRAPDPILTESVASGTLCAVQQRARHRVTMTVVAIGLCFSVTQGPSAAMVLIELCKGYEHLGAAFYSIFSITNSLVISGKTLNFILFCLSSEHFRKKCLISFFKKFPKLAQSRIAQHFDLQRHYSSDARGSLRTLRSRRGSQGTKEHRESTHLVERSERPHINHLGLVDPV